MQIQSHIFAVHIMYIPEKKKLKTRPRFLTPFPHFFSTIIFDKIDSKRRPLDTKGRPARHQMSTYLTWEESDLCKVSMFVVFLCKINVLVVFLCKISVLVVFLQKFLQDFMKKKKNTLNIRCLVDDSFVPATQQTSILY